DGSHVAVSPSIFTPSGTAGTVPSTATSVAKYGLSFFIHFIADIIVLVSSSAKAFIRLHIAGSPKDGEGIQREAGCADLHRIAAVPVPYGSGLFRLIQAGTSSNP
ncbi:hypothetical protein NE575_19425, partial [Clostridium sp. SL.3.18]|nr:hypothetical protein [Clostridium sp. SL.3.18]